MISGMFTSCIDYVQTLSLVDGYFLSNYKVTMSKYIMEQMDIESEDIFDISEEELEEEVSSYGCDYRAGVIDNDMDSGYEFGFAVDVDDGYPYDFMPVVYEDRGEIFVPFLLSEAASEISAGLYEEDEMSQAIALSMLNSARGRFIVSKSVLPEIRGAYFLGEEGDFDLPVYDYGDSYAVEIPLIVLAMGDQFDLEYLILY